MAIFRAKDSEDRKAAGYSFGRRFGVAPDPTIHFIGVWDTVESVGVPQLALRARLTSEPTVKASYTHVRHAVALDELRHPYTPRLYDVPSDLGPGRTFKQVWFSGAHADVGGGYADRGGSHRESGSSHAALHWMAREANAQGLIVDFDILDGYPVEALGRLHDQTVRVPLWTLAGARKRAYPPSDMCVHQSVADRADADARYRPPLPVSSTTIDTRSTVILPDGTLTYRPVPVVSPASNFGRESLSFKDFVFLLLAAAATYAAYVFFQPQNTALASLQLTGWNGTLGRALRDGTSPAIGNLCLALGADALFILIYGMCLFPLLIRFALRISDRDGYPGSVGLMMGYAGFAVIVLDISENIFTALAAGLAGGTSCYSPAATAIASFAAGMMSWGKLGALLIGALGLLFCLLRAAFTRRRA
jgi:hypothetical protein